MNVTLVALIGLPGAGKSTHVAQWMKSEAHGVACLAVNLDRLLGLNLDLKDVTWKSRRQEMLQMIQHALATLVTGIIATETPVGLGDTSEFRHQVNSVLQRRSLLSEVLMVVDDNLFYRSMRWELFRIAKACGAGYMQVFARCSLSTAIARNSQRASPVPQATIERMAANFEEPSLSDAGWESCTVEVNTERGESLTLSRLLEHLPAAREVVQRFVGEESARHEGEARKSKEKERAAEVNRANWAHQVDLALRKGISDILLTLGGGQAAGTAAKTLNECRKTLLEDLRSTHFVAHDTLEGATEYALTQLRASLHPPLR